MRFCATSVSMKVGVVSNPDMSPWLVFGGPKPTERQAEQNQ